MPETPEHSLWHIFHIPNRGILWGVVSWCNIKDYELEDSQQCSLICLVFMWKQKKSVILMCMLIMQWCSPQSFCCACLYSYSNCRIQQDRCSSCLAKASSETFPQNNHSPVFGCHVSVFLHYIRESNTVHWTWFKRGPSAAPSAFSV